MSEQKMREAFETWAKDKGYPLSKWQNGEYVEPLTLAAYAGWKAREALAAPAGEQVGLTDAWHVGWAVLASNGNIRIWHKEKADAEASQRKCGGELVRLTTIAPAEPAFPDDIRDILVSAFRCGSISGHERTVEGYWSEDDDAASEYADEIIAAHEAKRGGAV